MSVASEIARLQNAKASIKTAIENKGVTVGDIKLDAYSAKIDEISTGAEPTGTLEITQNGTYDVKQKAYAKVAVPEPSGNIKITENGFHIIKEYSIAEVAVYPTLIAKTILANGTYNAIDDNAYGYGSVSVNVPEKNLGTKTITANGTYKASDDNLDGYSQVEVETSGVNLDEYFKPTITSQGWYKSAWDNTLIKFRSPLTIVGTDGQYLFYKYPLAVIPEIDTSNVTIFTGMFENCENMVIPPTLNTSKAQLMDSMFKSSAIVNAPELDTSNVIRPSNKSFGGTSEMFYSCQSLISIPEYDFGKNSQTYNMLKYCTKLTTLGGFLNYGKALDSTSALNTYTALDLSSCTQLTHDSLMNVINKLYDIASAGYNTQKLMLGNENKAKLTAEEIAIATNKGWTVS